MVEGEILVAEDKIDDGIAELRAAIASWRTRSNTTSRRDG